ncbi:transglutaminase domain-containing protein [bacterium]|nr:transglutaminase domain-containing protein [bacterium]
MARLSLAIRKIIRFSLALSLAITTIVLSETDIVSQSAKDIVLGHYLRDVDSLKRRAALFLFDNMEGHSYITFDLSDTAGKVIPFDVLNFQSCEELEASFKTLESAHGVLDFKIRDVCSDDSAISASFVIDHVDKAFEAWQTRPWAKTFTFEQFCEYILPYRGSNEPLEKWRGHFSTRYDSAFHGMKDTIDPIEAACIINQDLMSWFRFDPRFYYHPTDQGLSEMLQNKIGRCEDMTNLTIYAMRANGLAVTSDYTPYWANSGNNHAWNAIVTTGGEVIPFMGAEANPRAYRLPNKLAKVYRKTFSLQRRNLAFQVNHPDDAPKYLSSKCYIDVTSDYTSVSDVRVRISVPDSIRHAYICVFNSGEWKAIHWGEVRSDSVTFYEMGVDVAYLPGLYVNGEIKPVGSAFLLTKAGDIRPAVADTTKLIDMVLHSTTMKTLEVSTDGILKAAFEVGTEYVLCYWSDGWVCVGKRIADGGPLLFPNVPSNGLYWLTAANSNKEERIFTYSDGQVWW